MAVDVIVTGSAPAVRPAQQATTTIPIVMGSSADPVGNGFVASLAHPAGNTTGLAGSSDDSSPKQLEMLATIVPTLSRVAVLTNPQTPASLAVMKRAQSAAEKANLLVVPVEARNPQEIEDAFVGLAKQNVAAVMIVLDPMFYVQRQQLAQLALRNRMASIFPLREFAAAGGLMSYGQSLEEFYRRAASFVDKIFKGAKPGDLPIEQPTRFDLVINRKTANAIGLTIPAQLYVFADEVIE
jgi:putative ABC transport system substrate-binding protein